METSDILQRLSDSIEKTFNAQAAAQNNKKWEWLKIVAGLAPFIIAGTIGITSSFTKLSTQVESFNNAIEQVKRDEESRAVKVDYNFSILKFLHPEINFIETKNPK